MRRLGVLAALLAAALALPAPARAAAPERILAYDVDLRVEPAGTLLVSERVDYDFGGAERHGIYRDVPVRLRYDARRDRVYRTQVLDVRASAGASAKYELVTEGSSLRIRVGDPDRTVSGRHTYTIRYRVTGALNGFADHDELYWNAIGAQWSVPVERASVRVTAPATVERVACYAGPPGSRTPCASSGKDGGSARFAHAGLAPATALTVVVGFPTGAVPAPRPILEERWTLAHAFSATPRTLGLAGLVATLLVLALLALLATGWRPGVTSLDRRARRAADADGATAAADGGARVEAAPPEGLRPAQVGLLVEKDVTPTLVSATMVDLAVRGYLRIEELPERERPSPRRRSRPEADWRVVELREAGGDLLGYERKLLDGLFRRAKRQAKAIADAGPPGDGRGAQQDGEVSVKLSSLRRRFAGDYRRVQSDLYDDAVKRGWFVGRPNRVRAGWQGIGVALALAGAAATVVVAWRTSAGLVPLPLLLGGLALALAARRMPSRTPAGRRLARRVGAFRSYLAAPGPVVDAGTTGAERFSPYLPYAIVLGLSRQWTDAFAGTGEPPATPWYDGTWRMYGPHPSVLGFTAGAESALAAPPATSGASGHSGGGGFSGGGFSGGGGGGGGGGSW